MTASWQRKRVAVLLLTAIACVSPSLVTWFVGGGFETPIFDASRRSLADDSVPRNPPDDVDRLQGLWSGSWGGGENNGVVFQPMIAEMLIRGEKIELSGFRDADRSWGLVRVDRAAKTIKVMLAKTASSPSKVLQYGYVMTPERLTMVDGDNVAIELRKRTLESNPAANVGVEFVTADRINDQGQLLITQFSALKVGRTNAVYYEAETRAIKTKDATIFVVEDLGAKKIALDVARKLLRPANPVAVAYRREVDPTAQRSDEFQTRLGSPQPDSEAALNTLARTLRPGTLVFVFPAQSAVPEP